MQPAVSRLLLVILAGFLVASPTVEARKKKPAPVPLSPAGQKLHAEYAAQLKKLQTQTNTAIPSVNDARKTAFLKAHANEGPKFPKPSKDSKKKPVYLIF